MKRGRMLRAVALAAMLACTAASAEAQTRRGHDEHVREVSKAR